MVVEVTLQSDREDMQYHFEINRGNIYILHIFKSSIFSMLAHELLQDTRFPYCVTTLTSESIPRVSIIKDLALKRITV